jgi:hypothetical protein
MKKPLLYILPFLLLSSLALAEMPGEAIIPFILSVGVAGLFAFIFVRFMMMFVDFADEITRRIKIARGIKEENEALKGKPVSFAGGVYDGALKDGKPHGQGTMEYRNGKKYIGKWKNGIPHGEGAEVHPNGQVVKGIWKGGKIFKVR